jgi:hypothetical protein
MRMHVRLLQAAVVIAAGASLPAFSGGGCNEYPYSDGINVEDVAGGTKILATSSVSVTLDDMDSVQDARDEATMEAKSLISKFMSEDINSDEVVNRVVNESKVSTAEGKSATREELVVRIKTLRNSSRALLRGAVTLGDCYTPGREMRVSVGIKPETVRSAQRLSGSISGSLDNEQTTPNAEQEGLQKVDGYSNTKALEEF